MQAVLRQALRVTIAITAIYAVLIFVGLAIYPMPDNSLRVIDSGMASDTVYETEAKYLYLNRQPLRARGPRVILLGASNTLVGLRPNELQPLIPGGPVHNMALPGSNLTEIAQILDLARGAMAPEDRASAVYVIGVWYGLFAEDAMLWSKPGREAGDTDVDVERYRYGYQRRTPGGPAAVVPDDAIWLANYAIYPLLILEKSMRVVSAPIRAQFPGAQANRTVAERNAYVLTREDQRGWIDSWRHTIGGPHLAAEQFDVLDRMIDRVRADGASVVLLDLPIPAWHAEELHYDREYATSMAALVARRRGSAHFSYVSLRDLNDDDFFCDEVHPRPRQTIVWARRASNSINEALGDRALAGAHAEDGLR